MRISSRNHAILDVATTSAALVLPRVLGASSQFTRVATGLALAKLGYGLLTRHEFGVVRLIPMPTHLALDAGGGAALCALPLLVDEEDPGVIAGAVALGLVDVVASQLTDRRSIPPRVRGVTTSTTVELPGERLADKSVPRERRLPTASAVDSMRVNLGVIAPTIAMGPIIRRPPVMKAAESLGFAAQAVKTLQALRDKYGDGPLMIRMPLRRQAVVLHEAHLRRVLEESPEPFATASVEKQAALAHFEPRGSLISHGPERTERRRLNEQTLEMERPVHRLAEAALPVVDEEAAGLLADVRRRGELSWDQFFQAWFRVVRRVVFGDSARDDHRITDLMKQLRSRGNWAFMRPIRTDLRDELHRRIAAYLERAETPSLAATMASKAPTAVSAPENQIPQWLFAFDPAAMAAFRGLALLAAHPDELIRARGEASGGAAARPHRPFLRATVLESLRLWPTTPMILRQTTRETAWDGGVMPAHTSVLIYAPFFHRDETRLPFAHAFRPDVWIEDDPLLQGNLHRRWPLAPFSGGPAVCPGRNLVLLLTSGMLAAMLDRFDWRLRDPQRVQPERLAGNLDHFTLRFSAESHRDAVAPAAGSTLLN